MDDTHGQAATLGFAIGYLLAGTALLLQELDVLTLRWSFVLPLIVLAVGLALLASGVLGAHRGRSATGQSPMTAGPSNS